MTKLSSKKTDQITVAIKAMNADILWHQKNPGGSACGPSFESGFICGLKQARRLTRKIRNASHGGHNAPSS